MRGPASTHGPPAGTTPDRAAHAQPTPHVIPFRARTGTRGPDAGGRKANPRTGVPDEGLPMLDGVTFTCRRVAPGQALYLEGDQVRFLYEVRQGSFKTVLLLRDGRDQVTRFPMAGDLLGLDGMGRGAHASSAVALEDSEVRAIPIDGVHRQLQSPEWRDALCRVMGQEIVRESRHMLVLGSTGTQARVAMFLLELSEHLQSRGYSAREFHMRMTRAEIGSYLGLTLETVSRTLSAFQQRGVLHVQKRHITIESLDDLRRIEREDGP
jgi:CRP/FNR family transcriptional regulator